MVLKEKEYLSEYMRQYYKDNKEKHLKAVKKWQSENKDKIRTTKKKYNKTPKAIVARKKYLEKTKKNRNKRRREYNKEKYKEDPDYWKKRYRKTKKKKNIQPNFEEKTECDICGTTNDTMIKHNNLLLCKRCKEVLINHAI